MQGYLLVDAKGNRIDAGPIEVVGDALKTSGTAAIVTGLSCMACHQRGMIPFKDTIREGLAVAGAARDKVERLFPEKAAMDKLLGRDEARFLKALDEATGPFLKVGDDRDKDIRDFAEPIGAVARAYLKDLGPAEVAGRAGPGRPEGPDDPDPGQPPAPPARPGPAAPGCRDQADGVGLARRSVHLDLPGGRPRAGAGDPVPELLIWVPGLSCTRTADGKLEMTDSR